MERTLKVIQSTISSNARIPTKTPLTGDFIAWHIQKTRIYQLTQKEQNINLCTKSKTINTQVKAISASQKITRMDICSCFLDVNLTQKSELDLNKRTASKPQTIQTGWCFLENTALVLRQKQQNHYKIHRLQTVLKLATLS